MDRPDVARRRAREWPWFLVAAVFALAPRILFARAFPTIPISDFASLVAFAVFVRDNALAPTGAYQFFGIGLPFALALVMKVVPGPAPEVVRYATAAVTGLAALAPFVIWRGVFRMATRLAATLLLALWPGHVFFSTAVAQDNWIFLPTIALAALAVRTLTARDEGHPLASAILFASSVAIRQEMIVAAAPLTLAAAGAFVSFRPRGRRPGAPPRVHDGARHPRRRQRPRQAPGVDPAAASRPAARRRGGCGVPRGPRAGRGRGGVVGPGHVRPQPAARPHPAVRPRRRARGPEARHRRRARHGVGDRDAPARRPVGRRQGARPASGSRRAMGPGRGHADPGGAGRRGA